MYARVVWASTSDIYFALHGVRPQTEVRAARRFLKLSRPFHVGRNDWYLARKGQGATSSRPVALSPNTNINEMFWAYGFRGRPARPMVEVMGDLIDASSVGGGTFELGSQAFVMTRLITGQLEVSEAGTIRLIP